MKQLLLDSSPLRPVLTLLLLAALGVGLPAHAADPELHRLRAQRRAMQHTLQAEADKSDGAALFGLLVIPVDFSDSRLPVGWDASDQLTRRLGTLDEHSLRHYFTAASGGRLDLRVTLAPLINLPGARRDYSDLGYNGFTRTRALASAALTAVRDLGLEFRSLDMEGPDRLPGTADDDGQLDGVLILHAGIGQENDPENGLVQALQYYLDVPVESAGIQASFYAVASLRSGPGIWAHETGHLLGMEDRYDPLLHPDVQGGDVRSLGGLGRFSLMASGAWGTGDGWGPALPDAYTCLQLGWVAADLLPNAGLPEHVVTPAVAGGRPARIWTRGEVGEEFFLLETRDPALATPYDAGLPAGQLLVYHVDEAVREGAWAVDGPGTWHLRVGLVEADADGGLAAGLDDGRPEDLFPGPLGAAAFGPETTPSSWGYRADSQVALSDITSLAQGVRFTAVAAREPAVTFVAAFGGDDPATLDLTVRSVGISPDSLGCRLSVVGVPAWGAFAGGGTSVDFPLWQTAPGIWRPAAEVAFVPEPGLPAGSATQFRFTFTTGGWESPPGDRLWVWSDPAAPLDFQTDWPGPWDLVYSGSDQTTTWHRWQGAVGLNPAGGAVLAATGSNFADPAAWPDVHYNNNAWVSLVSGPLGPGARAVRLVHFLETETLNPLEAMDGARILWVGPAGQEVALPPVDGWPTAIHPRAGNPLAGLPVFADSLLTTVDGAPVWGVDVVPLPAEAGPWRLKLEFASNSLWRYRGWFLGHLQVLQGEVPAAAFPLEWDPAGGLSWHWSAADLPVTGYRVQGRSAPSAPWEDLVVDTVRQELSAVDLLSLAGGGDQARLQVRVCARTSLGWVAGRPVVVYPDGGRASGIQLGAPRPNPSRGQIRFQLDLPLERTARLGIYDLRGRLVHARTLAPGSQLVVWDGAAPDGARVAAGTYFIRLEGSGPVQTRKVVLLH